MTKLVDATNLTPDELSTVPIHRLKLRTLRELSNTALTNAAHALRAYADALNEGVPDHLTDAAIWDKLLTSDRARAEVESVVQRAVNATLPDEATHAAAQSMVLDTVYSELQSGTHVEKLNTQARADARHARTLADLLTAEVRRNNGQ